MGGVALVAAFLLSIAPGVLSRLLGAEWGLDAVAWTPIALLPWLALSGCPRRERASAGPLAVAGLLLPALALAAASDVATGRDLGRAVALGAWGALLCVALAFAAQRGGRLHAVAWWLLVPAAALLLAARVHVGDLPPDGALASALETSPLAWPLGVAAALDSGAAQGLAPPIGPLAVVALLIVAGGRGRAMKEERD